jgi:hypothetical protein
VEDRSRRWHFADSPGGGPEDVCVSAIGVRKPAVPIVTIVTVDASGAEPNKVRLTLCWNIRTISNVT